MRASALLVLSLASVRIARAAPERDPVAIRLFDEGKALIADGKPALACDKFEAAHARVSWLGIELNLADCYERIGKTASAWGLFRRAADQADREGDPRATYARERVAALAPKLSHVAITSAVERPRDLEVRLDGGVLAAAELGESLPIDPGPHQISASAPGRIRWSRRIEIRPEASEAIELPLLAIDPGEATDLKPVGEPTREQNPANVRRDDHASPDRGRSQSVMISASVGFASLAGSIWFGIDAHRHLDRARDGHCDADLQCDRTGYEDVRAARWRGNLSTGLGASAAIAIGVGTVLYQRHRREIVVAPVAAPGSAGIVVRGHL